MQEARARKKPRAKKAAAVDGCGGPAKKPRREGGHAAARPPRPSGLTREQPLRSERSCNYAYLVAMDREARRRWRQQPGAQPDAEVDTSAYCFSKEELMRLATDRAICSVDVYDGRGAASTQAGSYAYDGWANVHQGLIERDQRGCRRARSTAIASLSMAPPSRLRCLRRAAAARRLHEEAELCGYCTCGLVSKAAFAQRPMEENEHGERTPLQLGLTADSRGRSALMSDDAWASWQPWGAAGGRMGGREAAFQQKLAQWIMDRDSAGPGGAAAEAMHADDGRAMLARVLVIIGAPLPIAGEPRRECQRRRWRSCWRSWWRGKVEARQCEGRQRAAIVMLAPEAGVRLAGMATWCSRLLDRFCPAAAGRSKGRSRRQREGALNCD